MDNMISILGNIRPKDFINEYWQQKPLLIRNALANIPTEITPEELAGLSLDEEARSRIVLEKHGTSPWECRYGPFSEQTFEQLPDTHWTLLVQDVEKLLPDFATLMDCFDFLPRWRIDDLMVSYAAPGGSVGPHLDQYDVFLLQGTGRRQWQIQQNNINANELLEDTDLQILKDFHAEDEWILEPGDMLYLPPGVAHYGIAIDECLTYSIGFRAPSRSELLQSLAETIYNSDSSAHYHDQIRHLSAPRGEVDNDSLEHIRSFMADAINDKELAFRSICSLLTEASIYLPEKPETATETDFEKLIGRCKDIQIHPAIRMLYRKSDDGLEWFIEGRPVKVSNPYTDIIESMVDNYQLDRDSIKLISQNKLLFQTIHDLYNSGGLILHEES